MAKIEVDRFAELDRQRKDAESLAHEAEERELQAVVHAEAAEEARIEAERIVELERQRREAESLTHDAEARELEAVAYAKAEEEARIEVRGLRAGPTED